MATFIEKGQKRPKLVRGSRLESRGLKIVLKPEVNTYREAMERCDWNNLGRVDSQSWGDMLESINTSEAPSVWAAFEEAARMCAAVEPWDAWGRWYPINIPNNLRDVCQ